MNAARISRWLIYGLIAVALLAIVWNFSATPPASEDISISQLAQQIKENQIVKIEVSSSGQQVTIQYADTEQPPAKANISGVSNVFLAVTQYSSDLKEISVSNKSSGVLTVYDIQEDSSNSIDIEIHDTTADVVLA